MNKIDLYIEVGNIDDDLITEAEIITKSRMKKKSLKKWTALAVCLTVITCSFIWLLGQKQFIPNDKITEQDDSIMDQDYTIAESSSDEYALTLNQASNQSADKLYIEGHFWQPLSNEEIESVFKNISDNYAITATANFSKKEDSVELFNIEGTVQISQDLIANITVSPKEIENCYVLDGESMLSEILGVSINAGYFDQTSDGKIIYYAYFQIEDVYYYIKMAGGKGEKAALPALIDEIICSGKADFSVLDPIAPKLRNDELTLEQAYEDEDFGNFLPKKIPNGYSLESANRFIDQNSNYLSALWCKGMSDIRFHVSYFSAEDSKRLTAISDTKNYDLSLYPIPRADSVPSELYEIVDNPIFSIEELTLEAVKMRSYIVEDKGDTDGYRMNFSERYDGKYLVEVNAKGVSPSYIFDELIAISNVDFIE